MLAAAAALAYRETHLGEIPEPLAAYVSARVDAIQALPSPTKAEKKELKLLASLEKKKLTKPSLTLGADFGKWAAAAVARVKLGPAGDPMQDALDLAQELAELALYERDELVQDHQELLIAPKAINAVQKKRQQSLDARADARAELAPDKRAKLFAKAEKLLTAALKKAEKLVAKAGRDLPPTRWRSGDLVSAGDGGRVAVPRASGSPVAGASIVFPPGSLPADTVITIGPGTSFVSDPDIPAGPAVEVGPGGLALSPAATIFVPYLVPEGGSVSDMALFEQGPPARFTKPVTPRSDGTTSASTSALTVYQAGLKAPAPGTPTGAYHVHKWVVLTSLDSADQDLSAQITGVAEQTFTFRGDSTGNAALGVLDELVRGFQGAPPHHAEFAAGALEAGFEFTWTLSAAGRFVMNFTQQLPDSTAVLMQVRGVVSADNRAIAFSGRGGTYEIFGVGVRGGSDLETADLEGRWVGVEAGTQLLDVGAEPFTTQWNETFRVFDVDDVGNVTFQDTGTRLETSVTYSTNQATAPHGRSTVTSADGGTAGWSVAPDGRVSGENGLRAGWLDVQAGLLTTVYFDEAAHRVELLVATPQPAASTPPAATWNFAHMDVGVTAGVASANSSTHEPLPRTGSLSVPAAGDATLAFDPATRAVYTLTGQPPLADMNWSMTSQQQNVLATSTPLTLALDAAGNHTPGAGERWFAFSGSGSVLLGLPNPGDAAARIGLLVGVR